MRIHLLKEIDWKALLKIHVIINHYHQQVKYSISSTGFFMQYSMLSLLFWFLKETRFMNSLSLLCSSNNFWSYYLFSVKLDRDILASMIFSVNTSRKIGSWGGRRKPSGWPYSGKGCNVSLAVLSDISESTQGNIGNLDLWSLMKKQLLLITR